MAGTGGLGLCFGLLRDRQEQCCRKNTAAARLRLEHLYIDRSRRRNCDCPCNLSAGIYCQFVVINDGGSIVIVLSARFAAVLPGSVTVPEMLMVVGVVTGLVLRTNDAVEDPRPIDTETGAPSKLWQWEYDLEKEDAKIVIPLILLLLGLTFTPHHAEVLWAGAVAYYLLYFFLMPVSWL